MTERTIRPFISSHASFQDQIVQAAACDIVVAIFGARLGTPLPDAFSKRLQSYRASRDIAEHLAKADPGNAGWQRDLALSYGHIAYTSLKAGQTADARAALNAARQIVMRLLA